MYWIERGDTFSYEYTVVAECETFDEAKSVLDWYLERKQPMSEYRLVSRLSDLRSTPIPEVIALAANQRARMIMSESRPLRPEDV